MAEVTRGTIQGQIHPDHEHKERTFPVGELRAGRAWVRETLPVGCLARDDCVMVLSELLANAAEHGGGNRVTVAVGHGPGPVRGVLVEHEARTGSEPSVQTRALTEIGRLLGAPVNRTPKIEDLLERGRGLAVVALLCQGAFETWRDGERRVSRWELAECVCEASRTC